MKLYYAPMEGITKFHFRNLHAQLFPDTVDAYYTPFLSPTSSERLSTKEFRDVLPENNEGVPIIPQILTNNAPGFLQTVEKLQRLGYGEVNLNIGCPSGTVVSKGRGAGFLAKPEELDKFLEEIFSGCPIPISVKTRIGMNSPEEFPALLEIFNRYPIRELTVHPRIRQEFYKGKPHLEVFQMAAEGSKNPLCYNGDVFTAEDYKRIVTDYPVVQSVMLGRGMVANPALAREIRGGAPLTKEELRRYHDQILLDLKTRYNEDRNAISHMKELWFYMAPIFTEHTKYAKKINKAMKMPDYLAAVDKLFDEQELTEGHGWHDLK